MARYEPALPRSGTNDWKLDYELFRANCKDWLEANALRDEHDELVEFVEGGEMYRDRTWVCASATRESYFGGNDSLGEEVGHELDHLGDDTHWGVRGQAGLALRFLLDGEETVLLWTCGGTPYALRRRLAEELFDRLYQGHPSDYEDVAWYAREHPDKVEAGEIAKPTPAWLLKLRYTRWRAVQPLLRLLQRSYSSDDLSRSDCELATVIRKQGEPPHLSEWRPCPTNERDAPFFDDDIFAAEFITSYERRPEETASLYKRWRCKKCQSVCEDDEWHEFWQGPCDFCGYDGIEGVALSTPLRPPLPEFAPQHDDDLPYHLRIFIPATGEFVTEDECPSRGHALMWAKMLAYTEEWRQKPPVQHRYEVIGPSTLWSSEEPRAFARAHELMMGGEDDEGMLFCVATETGENMWSQEVESWHNALRWCNGEDVEEEWEWEHAHKQWEPDGWDGPFYLFEVSGDDGLLWKSDQPDADELARELLEDEEKDGKGVLRLLVIPTGEILWEIATGSWRWALCWASKLVEREAAREDILAQAEPGMPYYEISVFCPEGKVWSSAEAEWRTLADEGARSK